VTSVRHKAVSRRRAKPATPRATKDRVPAKGERSYAALLESEQRYKQLFEVASDWFWETDTTGCLTYVSPNIEAVLHLPVSAYLGRRLAETEGVTYEREAGRVTLVAFKARRPYRDFIYARKLADGTEVWINSSGGPFYGEDGTFRGYRGVARDVTSQVEAERRLKGLERQYRQLFETASDWYWEQDLHGRLTFVSPNFEAATGIGLAAMLGRRLNEIPHVTLDPELGARTLDAVKARLPYRDLAYTLALPDGRVVHVGTSGMPMFDSNGGFRGYCGVSKDITAQVEADLALRKSEQRFRQMFEVGSDYYWEDDSEHRLTFASPISVHDDIYGVPFSQLVGKRRTETLAVSFDVATGKRALLAIKARQPYRDVVFSVKHPDGKVRWASVSGAPRFGEGGEFQGYHGTGVEITARKEAEAAAHLEQRRLHDAVAYVTQPFVVYDAEDRAAAFNQAFTDLFRTPTRNTPIHHGLPFRELADWQVRTGFYADGPEEEPVDSETLLAHHQTEEEHAHHLRDGRWMLVIHRRLPGGGRVELWTDVTAIKRVEAERRELETQLHHSQRLEGLGTLAGGAAHEINNALVPVIALTKLMAGKFPEDSRERRNLTTVLAGAERSRDLVKQILAFSRKEERRQESVDVAAVLRDALQLMRATVPSTIRLAEEIAAVPPVTGDPNQLHQVIVNLVTNAAQAIGEAMGTITVGLRPEADGAALRLWVADTGSGMDEAMKARIFEPFFTTREVGKGTGLGLAVVHGIIKDHGGSIEVESAPGQGTRFDIVLPLQAAEAGAAA
jgi:PAS domain S-box-containing protein